MLHFKQGFLIPAFLHLLESKNFYKVICTVNIQMSIDKF